MNQSERPRFFEGQYLGAEDLSAAVDYERVQSARHALAAHTWGIAIGLDLVERQLPSGDIGVTIAPGIAWDGYGRPVVVLAPARLTADKFGNFQADTPPEGQLVKVWLRYDETATKQPAAGFQACRTDDQNARIVESFAIAVGEPANGEHGSLSIAGRSVDAAKARSAFNPNAPDVHDESVPYQVFPDGKLPYWLIPIGYVRWLKQGGQPGRLIARNDNGPTPDSDQIRSFRRYVGAVAETVYAADGVIRMRDRWSDPKSPFQPPRATIDPSKPPNDLVWIEGHLRVAGDGRIVGGKLEFRDQPGDDTVPLALRIEPNDQGGRDLQIITGAEANPTGKHALAVGPVQRDAATGALTEMTKNLVVRDNGNVGIGTTTPAAPLDVAGRILRWGKDFSVADTVNDGKEVTVPHGTTTADWNIFVSPSLTPIEQPTVEFSNAFLELVCEALTVSNSTTTWLVRVGIRFWYTDANSNHQARWVPGTANYLLVPK